MAGPRDRRLRLDKAKLLFIIGRWGKAFCERTPTGTRLHTDCPRIALALWFFMRAANLAALNSGMARKLIF